MVHYGHVVKEFEERSEEAVEEQEFEDDDGEI